MMKTIPGLIYCQIKNDFSNCILYQSNISEGKSLILQKRSF